MTTLTGGVMGLREDELDVDPRVDGVGGGGPASQMKQLAGSTAGAGSGTFNKYQKERRKEVERIEKLEREDRREAQKRAAEEERARREREDAERTAKNAARRKRKRAASSKREDGQLAKDGGESGDDRDEGEGEGALSKEEEEALLRAAQEVGGDGVESPST